MTEENKTKPKQKITCGGIKITVWENKGEKGDWNTYQVERVYKNKDGEWKTTNNFREGDLLPLAKALEQAFKENKLKIE